MAIRALLTTGLKTLAPLLPGLRLSGSTFLPRAGPQPRGGLGDQLHRAASHQSWGGPLPPGRSPCVIAMGAQELFQLLRSTREVRDAIAVAQTRPITAAAFEQLGDRRRARARSGVVPGHCPTQPLPAPLHRGLPALVRVVQAGRRPLDPARGAADGGPQRRGRVQPALQDGLQARAGLGPGPLCSTRSRRSAMAVRRSWRVRPEAASGGRPSLVRARRTARQEPCLTSAGGSGRPARGRALGRIPRTRFFSVFLAWRSASEMGCAASRRAWQ